MSQLDPSAKWFGPAIARYGAAILLVVAALLICRLVPRVFSINTQPLFLAAVILSTWFDGLWPGLLTVALSSLTIEWFNLPPNFAFGLTVEDMPRYTEFILVALLIATLTGRQKHTNEMLQAEMAERQRADEALQKTQADLARVTRATTLGEMAASIAHEVNQPLAAVVINGNACLRWLAGETPNLDEARAAVEHIISDGHRAGKVIAQIRALVENAPPKRVRLNINDLVLDTIALAHREIAKNQAVVRTELAADLPAVVGDRIQLQQVFLNLIMNGLEAPAGLPLGYARVE
jgi:signal transduction histidine kinase